MTYMLKAKKQHNWQI